jgi:hypothetical protein
MLKQAVAIVAGLGTASAMQICSADPGQAAAPSAVVTAVDGSALVSSGDEIVPAKVGMDLEPLTRVFVLEDSETTLQFADGCEEQLPENAVLTIGEGGSCNAGTVLERAALGQADPAPPAAGAPGRRRAAAGLFPGASGKTGLWILGGLGAAGVVWAASESGGSGGGGGGGGGTTTTSGGTALPISPQ